MHHIRKFPWNLAARGRKKFLSQAVNQDITRSIGTIEFPPKEEKIPEFSIPKGILGQPTFHTHPHLVPEGHLTCGITQLEYRDRRDTFMNKLVAEVENVHSAHIVIIPAADKQYMSDKIPYVFRQNSDFFYLTGCMEPAAVLVMLKPPQTDTYKTLLFVHEKDSHAELWEGPRTGCSASTQLFAVDESQPIEYFANYLKQTASSVKPSTLWYQSDCPPNREIHSIVRSVLTPDSHLALADPQRVLHFMRVIKSPAEVELMKETCRVGSESLNMAMAYTKPGVSEHMVNAVLDYASRQGGAEHLAFPPVVAGGARATHIHYVTNNQLLAADEMLLVDTGCQRWLYNSDISRTFPVSGKFSAHHRILYELVLTVQKRLIQLLGENRPPLDQLFDQMCRLLGSHLQQEGILRKDIDGSELMAQAYRLCPHHVSHYLGLDVHDAPLVRRQVPVQPNMIITVEPGIYIRPDDRSVPPEFRGVGIRIEDDVLITEDATLILTDACAKEVADIEALVGTQHTY